MREEALAGIVALLILIAIFFFGLVTGEAVVRVCDAVGYDVNADVLRSVWICVWCLGGMFAIKD